MRVTQRSSLLLYMRITNKQKTVCLHIHEDYTTLCLSLFMRRTQPLTIAIFENNTIPSLLLYMRITQPPSLTYKALLRKILTLTCTYTLLPAYGQLAYVQYQDIM